MFQKYNMYLNIEYVAVINVRNLNSLINHLHSTEIILSVVDILDSMFKYISKEVCSLYLYKFIPIRKLLLESSKLLYKNYFFISHTRIGWVEIFFFVKHHIYLIYIIFIGIIIHNNKIVINL